MQLLTVLDPDVVVRSDRALPLLGGADRVRGREAVLHTFLGRAQGTRTALLDGAVGAVRTPGGRVRGALEFTIAGGRITAIDVICDPDVLDALDVVPLDTRDGSARSAAPCAGAYRWLRP